MKKLCDLVEKVQCWFSMAMFIVFLICIILQILSRYVPFITVTWTEEVAVYTFIWAVLMGAAVELKRNEHFSFEYFRSRIKSRSMKLLVETVIHGLILAFSIYMVVAGGKLTKTFWYWTLTNLTNVSQRFIWSSLVVSGATMALYSINALIDLYTNPSAADPAQNPSKEEAAQ